MALAKKYVLNRLLLSVLLILVMFVMSVIWSQTVSASGGSRNRPPYNGAENNTYNRCVSEGWQSLRYGAIWFTTGSYYDGSVNITATSNSATVYIRGSVFGCHNGSTNNTYAVNVAPYGPEYWRLTGMSSTSLFRGTSQGAHNWSTQGGQISATLDVSGLATNNATGPDTQTITIDLYRCFSTNPTSPTGACYTETIPITVTREAAGPPPPSSVQVQGRVKNATTGVGVSGVSVVDCRGNTSVTNAAGDYFFTHPVGGGYCARISSLPGGYSNQRVWPWGEGYASCAANTICAISTYECQIAGQDVGVQACGSPSDIDRASDRGFDFAVDAPAPAVPCPGWNLTPPPPNVAVFLPDTAPNDPAPSGGPVGSPWSPSTTRTQNVRSNRTQATATDDISATDTGARVGSPAFRLPLVTESYQNATISYKPFIDDYPYDFNQANITYNSYYRTHTWTGTDDWRWEYDYSYYTCTSGSNKVDSNGDGVPDSGWSCDSGYWTDVYSWHYYGTSWSDNGPGPEQSVSNTINAPTMNPCYNRDFNLTPRAISAVWSPSSEEPNQVRFFSQIDYSFTTTADGGIGVRRSLKVRTNVTGDYYIRRGASIIRPIPPPASGPDRCGGNYSASSTSILIDSNNYGRSASGTFDNTDCFNVSVPPLQMGDIPCFTISTNPSQGGMYPDGSVRSVSAGNRTSAELCNSSNPVQNLPYMRVYTNDVFAGGGLIGSTCRNSAGIYAYQNGTGRGSTTQLAAYALSQIDQFGSAQRKSPDFGLTFGNQAGYGNFDSTQCIPDYYGTRPDVTTPVSSPINISPLGTGGYQHNGDATISGGNINPGQRTALYINGNVHITGPTQFMGTYRTNNTPTLFVIATGNIYIDPSVTRLDGIFIAQGGTIYTCASHPPPFSASELFNNCTSNKQLVINGGLIGQSIKFQRAFSSLRHSTSTETPIGANHPCDVVGGVFASPLPVCGAEVINFDPLFYLSLPPFRSDSNRRYDAITSLPPVL